MQIGHGFFIFGFGVELFGLQGFGALRVQLRQLRRSLGIGQVALSLDEIGFVSGRVELGDNLSFRYGRVEVHEQLLDDARNLAAHFHFDQGGQFAGGGYELRQLAARDDGHFILQRVAGRPIQVPAQACTTRQYGHQQ